MPTSAVPTRFRSIKKTFPWWTPSNRNVPFCGLDVVYSIFHQFQISFSCLKGTACRSAASPRVEPMRGKRYTGEREDRDRRKPGGRRGGGPEGGPWTSFL